MEALLIYRRYRRMAANPQSPDYSISKAVHRGDSGSAESRAQHENYCIYSALKPGTVTDRPSHTESKLTFSCLVFLPRLYETHRSILRLVRKVSIASRCLVKVGSSFEMDFKATSPGEPGASFNKNSSRSGAALTATPKAPFITKL